MRVLGRFGRFGIVGVLGAALQLILFRLFLQYPRLPAAVAAALAVELVVLHNFLWNERLTFGERRSISAGQRAVRLWRFHLGNGLASLAGNTLLTFCLVNQLHAPALPSAVAAIALCAPLNFLIADRWVYTTMAPRAEGAAARRVMPVARLVLREAQAWAPASKAPAIHKSR